MSKLWYRQPAKQWEEALPIGNGRLGAMVFGGIRGDHLQVNEESIWYGGKVNRINPDFKKNLPVIRRLLDEGRIAEAENLMDRAMSGCPEGMHPYQTLGDVNIYYGGIDEQKVTEYKRSLDLETGVATVEFMEGDTLYKREIFATRPGDCIVMRLTAGGEGFIQFGIRLRRGAFFDGVSKYEGCGVSLFGNLGRGGSEFRMTIAAKAIGEGEICVTGECLECRQAKEVLLFFTADSTYHYSEATLNDYVQQALKEGLTNEDRRVLAQGETGFFQKEREYQAGLQQFLAGRIRERLCKVMNCGYETVLQEHLADYGALYNRFSFEIKGAEAYETVPTDERLQMAKENGADVGLSKTLFDFGRYLTISCSRKGDLPANLQGIWAKDFTPPWDSKYTININAEMNYWHVEQCGLGECHEPLLELIKKVQINGRKVAKEMYGCRGFVAHHNTDIHGDAAPQDIWYPGSFWTMGAAWLCTHLWMHYQYGRDKAFLLEAFPIMAESALFFVDFLIERKGYLVTSPSVSPENTYRLPNGETGSCCVGPTMDNQILRHLFTGVLSAWKEMDQAQRAASKVEGVTDVAALMADIENCMNRLVPTQIGSDGRIMEWPEEYEEVEPGHRHISHLYGLYPAGEITMDETPELAAAARKTLEYRLSHGGGHTGWSRAWIMNHYASLWDGETAYDNIQSMLGRSTYPNMFDMHPPFQIDGNFGAAAAMCGMLAQSNENRVRILPALPSAWNTGSVKGLHLVGNAVLSMDWKDGELQCATITANSDYETVVYYKDRQQELKLKVGETGKLFC